MKPLVLCILDGVGIREEGHGNAFLKASKPNFDRLWSEYPHSLLEASGVEVGLPAGQMGNSEVGHMNIGAGRVVYQPLQLIYKMIEEKEFFSNETLISFMKDAKMSGKKLHLMGLLSDGGIHSHIDHLFALIDIAHEMSFTNLYIHAILDGRDTLPDSAIGFVERLENKLKDTGVGVLATLAGRYYAMDRDNRFDRVALAYDNITVGSGIPATDAVTALKDSYVLGITDEFVKPILLSRQGLIEKDDAMIIFNYRPDRLRELPSALTNKDFKGFVRQTFPQVNLLTMMPVSDEVICKSIYHHEDLKNTFGEYIDTCGLKQLRIAETEKYAHVTYFFDGGFEKNLAGCTRVLVPSPKVATYDLEPQMSAVEITNRLITELDHSYDVVILNYANGDMVGHTGKMAETIKSVEVLDDCLGKLYDKVESLNGTLIVIADHGNCDYMLDDMGNVITSHSTSLVPFIITDKKYQVMNGKLGDVAPTMLTVLGLDVPKEMTGDILIRL